ncbi:MAG: 2-C-methyl-D-erythritol 2,4-cyclodiphosphate synthase [Kiritimatiellae bacterium]|nr:2-C-methyl-D-erythritol 2,4-cyclodiphosphate synthase [Kiritimatiellia bacterium]
MRIGFGYDSHVFESGRPLVLGGVLIPDCDGLKAHSDGDVLIHAVIDALYGAAAMGDIGSHFPDTDGKWKDADSALMLKSAMYDIRGAGYAVENLDVTVVCERPRLRPFADLIRSRLSDVMGVGLGRISVKGKSNEKMDDVGAGKGIVVHAAVLLKESGAQKSSALA